MGIGHGDEVMTDIFTTWYTDGPIPFRVRGSDIQTVEFLMGQGDRLMLQPHTFLAGTVAEIGVSMGRRLRDPFLRRWSGESIIMQEIRCKEAAGWVVLGAQQIGKIARVSITKGQSLICQRGAFIAAAGEIHIGVAFTSRLRAGLFGGQGMVFQRLTGEGDVFLHAVGSLLHTYLPEGRMLRINPHHILAFESSVGYDVQFAGRMATLLFGQQTLLDQLQGPGRVLIQSMTLDEDLPIKGAAAKAAASVAGDA